MHEPPWLRYRRDDPRRYARGRFRLLGVIDSEDGPERLMAADRT